MPQLCIKVKLGEAVGMEHVPDRGSVGQVHAHEVVALDGVLAPVQEEGRLGARRTVLTHLSHDVDHARHASLLPPGVELAYDGQRIEVDLAG